MLDFGVDDFDANFNLDEQEYREGIGLVWTTVVLQQETNTTSAHTLMVNDNLSVVYSLFKSKAHSLFGLWLISTMSDLWSHMTSAVQYAWGQLGTTSAVQYARQPTGIGNSGTNSVVQNQCNIPTQTLRPVLT